MNNHQLKVTPIKDEQTAKCSFVLDKLSICFNDPNPENVKKTYGLLISDHVTSFTPGMSVTKNQRYMASCRLRLPFDSSVQETAFFEVGPRCPGLASYRLEFNPAKFAVANGLDDLIVFLTSAIDPDPIEFFRGGKVTRCDVAIDLPDLHLEDVIVRASRLQKHGLYSDRHGYVQTTYIGTPTSRRIVAYEKSVKGASASSLRLECRVKPRCLGYETVELKNPFTGVTLIPAAFPDATGIGIPSQFLADSLRIGGAKRVLMALDASQRKVFKKALKEAQSVLPDLDTLWLSWPHVLIGCGLGKHLGALQTFPATKSAVNCKSNSAGAVGSDLDTVA